MYVCVQFGALIVLGAPSHWGYNFLKENGDENGPECQETGLRDEKHYYLQSS